MRESEYKFFETLLLTRQQQILRDITESDKELAMLGEQKLSDELDYASASAESLVGSSISLRQRHELEDINIALRKIRSGTYGICDMCEESISIQRLKVKPHAKYCITCREIIEKRPN
ncbi:MAG: RNA polymerase-binding protein DksA [Wolinella sp.]